MSLATLGKKLALTMQALTLAFGFGAASLATVSVAVPAPAYAAACSGTLDISSGADCANPGVTNKGLFEQDGIFQTIAKVLIFLVGAIAVLFLIIGGLRYVVSNGDAKNVEAAKNTILYAIVGIIVAVLSYAAVTFVINSLK